MFSSRVSFYAIFIYSIISISFALYLEFVLGHEPCKLCIYQRIPYYLIIIIGLVNLFYRKFFTYLYLLIGFLLLIELLVSAHHTLNTFGLIEYTGCESASLPSDINQLKEALLSDTLIVNCSNANLKYFGLPLSLYNALFSIMFLIIIGTHAYKKKNLKN